MTDENFSGQPVEDNKKKENTEYFASTNFDVPAMEDANKNIDTPFVNPVTNVNGWSSQLRVPENTPSSTTTKMNENLYHPELIQNTTPFTPTSISGDSNPSESATYSFNTTQPSSPSPTTPIYSFPPQSTVSSEPVPTVPQASQASVPLGASIPPSPSLTQVNVQPTTSETASPKKSSGFLKLLVLAVVVSVVVTSGVIIGGLRSGILSPVTTANVAKNYETEQYNKAFEKSDAPVDWAKLYASVNSQVVSIQLTLAQGGVQGSGFVLDNKGHIITNNHVVENADKGKLEVYLSDGRIFDAKVVGTDPSTDVAVIALQNAPDDLQPVEFSDSEDVIVGDQVMAVGAPLGLSSTATVGVVSAINRPVAASDSTSQSQTSAVVTNAIQIDAAINPGNSGGPLFNSSGKVIGITSSIATTSSTSGSIGIGFAIPSNLTRLITGQLVANGSADHPALGVTIKDDTITVDGANRRAVVVQEVGENTPAKNAGLQKGDAIIGLNDKPIISTYSLIGYVRAQGLGSAVKVTYIRDGKKYDTTMNLDRKQEEVLSTLPQQQQQQQGGGGFNPFGDN